MHPTFVLTVSPLSENQSIDLKAHLVFLLNKQVFREVRIEAFEDDPKAQQFRVRLRGPREDVLLVERVLRWADDGYQLQLTTEDGEPV